MFLQYLAPFLNLLDSFCVNIVPIPLQNQLEEEEKLAKQQAEVLKTNYKKYEMIDSVLADGAARRLARHYNFNVSDD